MEVGRKSEFDSTLRWLRRGGGQQGAVDTVASVGHAPSDPDPLSFSLCLLSGGSQSDLVCGLPVPVCNFQYSL